MVFICNLKNARQIMKTHIPFRKTTKLRRTRLLKFHCASPVSAVTLVQTQTFTKGVTQPLQPNASMVLTKTSLKYVHIQKANDYETVQYPTAFLSVLTDIEQRRAAERLLTASLCDSHQDRWLGRITGSSDALLNICTKICN